MAKAARIGDHSNHPGGTIGGAPPIVTKVWIENAIAAVAGDAHVCTTTPPPHLNSSFLVGGSAKVFIGGLPAARVGDAAGCGATITAGASKTEVG
jgi:uncharacterized Zn-binding protein involved in type VI secretion